MSPASKLLAEAATIAAETTLVQGVTAQQQFRGLTAGFDYDAPLPPLNIHPPRASWEPASRRFRDLTETEKSEQ